MATAPEKTGSDLTDEKYWDMLNRKSVSRFFLLASLSDRPQHGYELRRSIGQCCPGAEPTDAMIYPTLKILLGAGTSPATLTPTGRVTARFAASPRRGKPLTPPPPGPGRRCCPGCNSV